MASQSISRPRVAFFPVVEPSRELIDALEERYGSPGDHRYRAVLIARPWRDGALSVSRAIDTTCNLAGYESLSNEATYGPPGERASAWRESPAPTDACRIDLPLLAVAEGPVDVATPGACDLGCAGGENLGPLVRETLGRAAEWDHYWRAREACDNEMHVACVLSAGRARAWGTHGVRPDGAWGITKTELRDRLAASRAQESHA